MTRPGLLRRSCACLFRRSGGAPNPPPGPADILHTNAAGSGLQTATLASLKAACKEDRAVRYGLYLDDVPCKVVKVYDGDSMTIAWERAPGQLCHANARLFGIDTPELRGTTGEERARAEACRDRMAARALGQLFLCTTCGTTGLDKYGRPLVMLSTRRGWTAPGVCDAVEPYGTLNEWALATLPGCVRYFGGTKGKGKAEAEAEADP